MRVRACAALGARDFFPLCLMWYGQMTRPTVSNDLLCLDGLVLLAEIRTGFRLRNLQDRHHLEDIIKMYLKEFGWEYLDYLRLVSGLV